MGEVSYPFPVHETVATCPPTCDNVLIIQANHTFDPPAWKG